MNRETLMFPNARIPYGTWGSSFFPAWQTSPMAEVNIGQFAGEAAGRILAEKKVPLDLLEYLVIGSTVPWHWKFWNAGVVSSCLGRRLPGFHMEQACATGLAAVLLSAAEVESGMGDFIGVLTFDRTSDSSVGVFPERRSHARTIALSDVWDNFGFDPATGNGMLEAAGITARKHALDRREVDELAFCRYEQYFDARQRGFLDRVLVPLTVLDSQGRDMGKVDEDAGVRRYAMDQLRSMGEFDTCVTAGTQTHPSDGMAVLMVAHERRAREISLRPEIDIAIVARTVVRAGPCLMPEAPALAVRKLLGATGLTMEEMAVVKSHNPFALNDLIFARLLGYEWHLMNRTGSPLVWGHPQGPTLTRVLIEGIEETVELGGGYLLVCGCAAGDMGIAAILKVT